MLSKKVIFFIIGLFVIVAIGGYIYFLKKSKVLQIKPSETEVIKRKIEKNIVSPPAPSLKEKEHVLENKESIKEKIPELPEKTKFPIEKEEEKKITPSWTEEFFVTYFFIEDICKFILSSYFPAHSIDNPNDKNLLRLDFKVINARYGLELLGFRIQISDIKKARKEILSRLMDPETLKTIYTKYGDLFVKELYELAKENQRVFIKEGKKEKRFLKPEEIKNLFILLSNYIHQISGIVSAIANDPEVFILVKSYIKAQNDSIHYNYVLNQIINEYKLINKKNISNSKLRILEKRKDTIIKKYRSSIQQKEIIRKQILLKIKSNCQNITIEDHEILYIVEWFYRRFHQTPNIKVLFTISNILDDLEIKLRTKAKEI